jgi:hypothetical protein
VSDPIHVVRFPIDHEKHSAAHLVYTPQRTRERTQQGPTLPVAPQIELPVCNFSGDRGMLERQPAPKGRILALICSVAGIAVAAAVWAITSMPDSTTPLAAGLGNDESWLAPVATRPQQPHTQDDVVRRAMLEPKRTQEPANSPERSEPAYSNSTTATLTEPPSAQMAVPAVIHESMSQPTGDSRTPLAVGLGNDESWLAPVATRPQQPHTQDNVVRRAMLEPKRTQEPANSPERSEPAYSNSSTATLIEPPSAQAPVPAPAAVTHEPMPQPKGPDFVTRHLDADELASMLRRADDLIKSGDFSSARLLLRRIAEAGDARAAFALAGTFDPTVLRALGMRGGAPDIALARLWYERAAQLGSADATRRIQQLATASAQ